jgi:hypothetical protein
VDGLQIGAAADELTRMAAGFLEQDRQSATHHGRVEGGLLLGQERLKLRQSFRLHGLGDLVRHRGRGGTGPLAVFE